jgi:hypothetical protein
MLSVLTLGTAHRMIQLKNARFWALRLQQVSQLRSEAHLVGSSSASRVR